MKSELQNKLEIGINEIQKRIAKEQDSEMKDFMKKYRNHLEEVLLKEKRFFTELNHKPKHKRLWTNKR